MTSQAHPEGRLARWHIGRALAPFTLALLTLSWTALSQRARTPPVVPVSAPGSPPVNEPPALPPPPAPAAHPPLLLDAVNGGDPIELTPLRDDGGFSDADLERAAIVFSQQSPGRVHPVAPRLLDLVYRAVRHFDGGVVHVVSGFRADRAGSRHTQGRAVDMRIDGVTPVRLAAYLRGLGFVGVGLYPKSGFVHLDVRDASYFWIDDTAPGVPGKLVPVREDEARKADLAARARGEQPDLFVPNSADDAAAAAKVYARRKAGYRKRTPR